MPQRPLLHQPEAGADPHPPEPRNAKSKKPAGQSATRSRNLTKHYWYSSRILMSDLRVSLSRAGM